MGLVDKTNGEVSPVGYSLDSEGAITGDNSLLDRIGGAAKDTADFATKGIPLTAMSIVNSFANTPIALYNLFGGHAGYFDENSWDGVFSGDTLDYYREHKQGIETAGLVIGSLLPGAAAFKGYQAATKMAATRYAMYQAGEVSDVASSYLGLLPGVARKNILNDIEVGMATDAYKAAGGAGEAMGAATEATEAYAANPYGGAAFYNNLRVAKALGVANQYGDAFLASLAVEAASNAAMLGSPLLRDSDIKDVTSNMFQGALLGGFLGGTVDSFFMNGQINKARMVADRDSKLQEHFTDLGAGPFTEPDRMVDILKSVDKLDDSLDKGIQLNWLQRTKATGTRNNALTEAQISLNRMTGDADVSAGVLNTIMKQRQAIRQTADAGGDLDKLYNFWSNLAGAGRVMEDVAPTSMEDTFFLNRFNKDSPHVGDLSAYFTPKAGMRVDKEGNVTEVLQGVDTSMAYKIDKNNPPRMASPGDEIRVGDNAVKITTAKEAFDAGYDVFVRYDGGARVNPDSTRITQVARPGEGTILPQYVEREFRSTGKIPEKFGKAIVSDPQYIDTVTGNVTDTVSPVVGDLGRPEVTPRGLVTKVGTNVTREFNFKVNGDENLITPDTDPLEANARYVWAAKRGIKVGDDLNSEDPAYLEQLYREFQESGKDYNSWTKIMKGVKVDGGEILDAFGSPQDILEQLYEVKKNLISDAHDAGELNLDQLARLANAPAAKAAQGLFTTPEELMEPIENSSNLRHIKAQFKLGSAFDQDGNMINGFLDAQYRKQIINDRIEDAVRNAQNVATGVMPELERIKIDKTSTDAIIDASGAGFLKQSQGAYGSFRQACESVGRQVNLAIGRWSTKAGEAMGPSARELRNPDNKMDFMKLSNFVTAARSTGEQWTWLPDELRSELPWLKEGQRVAVLKKAINDVTNPGAETKKVWDHDFIPKGFIHPSMTGEQTTERGLRTFYVLDQHGGDFLKAHHDLNGITVRADMERRSALGLSTPIDPDIIYVPAIDTKANPHFFLARPKSDTSFGRPNYSMVTAASEDDLWQKRLALENEFEIINKDGSVNFHKAMGDYDSGRGFYSSRTDGALARKGILNDIVPVTNPDNLIRQFADFHAKMGTKMVREYTELANSQLFAELKHMGDRFTSMASSKTENAVNRIMSLRSKEDPYDRFMKTALDVSPKEEYQLWNNTNEAIEATADTVFKQVADAIKMVRVKGDVDTMLKMGEAIAQGGLGNPFEKTAQGMARYGLSEGLPPAKYLSNIIKANNAMIGSLVIKFDPLQQLLHAVSTPILMASEGFNVMNGGAMRELVQTSLPGTKVPMWAVAKPMFNSVKNFWNRANIPAEELEMMSRVVEGRTMGTEEMATLRDVAMPYGVKWDDFKYAEYMKKINNFISKPYEWTEAFTNFVTADMARQVFKAQGFEGKALEDNMTSFVNRVKANILTSQRPVAFQGPLGQAVGLFQTYYLNMMQNIFRYVENGEAKTLGLLLGLQGTLFGVQGLPGVNLINRSVAMEGGNSSHADLYSILPDYMGKDLAKWVLYGSTSNILGVNLYQRSELNPRSISLIPTNPADWPGVSGAIRFYGNLYNTVSKIANGGDVWNSLTMGLEHNGLSRPLTGLAELIQGYSTTSKGGLIQLNHPAGMNELFNGAMFARLLGGRPLDEAIVLNDMYRRNLYAAKDRARLETLGEAVKSKMIDGKELSADDVQDFAARYSALGGNIKQFNSAMVRWHQQSRSSIANKVFDHLQEPRAQQAMKAMGGRPLVDYNNSTQMAPPPQPDLSEGAGQ